MRSFMLHTGLGLWWSSSTSTIAPMRRPEPKAKPTTPCCQICGSRKSLDEKQPGVCAFLCYWTLEGWLGWNAREQVVAVRDHRALRFVPTHKKDKASRISYPKMVAMARMLGWRGRENAVGTFAAKAKAAGA
jgi:hypothetical protein